MFFKPEDALKFDAHVKQQILASTNQRLRAGQDFTVENARAALDFIAERAAANNFPWYKTMRPHVLIPEISHFKVPDGDYSIGVEIEHAPCARNSRREAIGFLKDLPYVCVDSDGGGSYLEATFPPILLSQLSDKWDACRYLDFVAEKKLMIHRNPDSYTGIHINVGSGKNTTWKKSVSYYGTDAVFTACLAKMGVTRRYVMFGRNSKSYYQQKSPGSEWVEMRMFHTTTDSKLLLWYAMCAVTMLWCLNEGITKPAEFVAEMDKAYLKHWGKAWDEKKQAA